MTGVQTCALPISLLGGAIALAASQLLWPVHELATYASQLAGLLRDLRAQLVAVTAPGDGASPAWREAAADARRRFGLAVTNAEATMQRLITEDAPNPHRVEAAMAVLTYGRRMASTMAAIAESRARGELAPPESAVPSLTSRLDELIGALEGRAAHGTPVPPDPPTSPPSAGEQLSATELGTRSLQSAQLDRLRAQLSVMERAIARYLAA